jgi:2-polyprenyl-6-hydroxyphenyl methylase/3-demethylubiquinone-9 3-methyltransferase
VYNRAERGAIVPDGARRLDWIDPTVRRMTAINHTTNAPEVRFEFGRNWTGFVRRNLDEERIAIAKNHLLAFIKRQDLNGLDFLDIGSGSGIHSMAAFAAGARRIFSFDYDPNSVAATSLVRKRAGTPENWTLMQGDVLSDEYIASLGKWNFVYSWGVLHHTGDVWRAIDNASRTVADGGLFYIALYSADTEKTPEFWLDVKRRYNAASAWGKRRMVWWYVWNYMLYRDVKQLPRFLSRIARYRMSRGMSLFVDVRDWLGGWPMEFTHDQDVVEFLGKRGFALENIKAGEANTEFLFIRKS